MSYASYLFAPYFPNRQHKKKLGRPTPYKYFHRIAYTETERGLHDEIPTLLFYGAPFALVGDACKHIFRVMAGKVENLIIRWEHSCRWRNGKCYWRVAVNIVGLNEHFISLREFILLFISRLQTLSNCKIRHYRLATFLNL